MARRTRQFFATIDEVATWLRELTADSIGVVIQVGKDPPVSWDGADGTLRAAWRAYLTPGRLVVPIRSGVGPLNPARSGWAVVDLPSQSAVTLSMTGLGAKSDWYDPTDGHVYENPSAIDVFDTVWNRWRRHLTRGVNHRWREGGPRGPARGVQVSAGARAWVAGGGKLAQLGAVNVVYELASTETLK